jgi:GNAT superfamily N-acetyltransferase
MGELDLATVAAANDAWVLTPEGSEVVETAEYRLVKFPEPFTDPLQVSWVRSARPAEAVLEDVVARAVGFGLPEAFVYAKLSAPEGFDEALLRRGAQLVDTCDVLALALPADVKAPDLPGFEVRWRTTPEVARDANTVGISAFGGNRASDDELAKRAAADRATVAAGTGGALVAYLDGGAVLEPYRGRGLYRALVAARLTYAAEHGATLAFTQGRISTSSPILQRLGFTSYGQERCYLLPLE